MAAKLVKAQNFTNWIARSGEPGIGCAHHTPRVPQTRVKVLKGIWHVRTNIHTYACTEVQNSYLPSPSPLLEDEGCGSALRTRVWINPGFEETMAKRASLRTSSDSWGCCWTAAGAGTSADGPGSEVELILILVGEGAALRLTENYAVRTYKLDQTGFGVSGS